MKLLRIELQGFKSFADPTRLDFDTGTTAIIGPNGSGKSNISESIRWVLGEQSSKALRGKASTDVLFSGAGQRQRASRAWVALTFDNESGRMPVDAAEVTVRRRLTSDGTGEYTVNGDSVRLVDLQHMLAAAGIGTKSYTVISQGMVDRYLTATPQGRQELFDEATGVRALHIQLTQAQKKLDKVRRHKSEVALVMKELEPRLRVLQRQIDRMQQRETVQKQYETTYKHYMHTQWHATHASQTHTQAAMADIADRITHARTKREAAQARLVAAADAPDTALATLRHKMNEAQQAYNRDMDTYTHAQQQQKALTQELAALKKELVTAEDTLQKRREESAMPTWVEQARAALVNVQGLLKAILGKTTVKRHDLEQASRDVSRVLAQADASQVLRDAQRAIAHIEEPLKNVARLKALEQERGRALEALPQATRPSDENIQKLKRRIAELETAEQPAAQQLQTSLQEAHGAELALEREASAARASHEQLSHELTQIEREVLRELGTDQLKTIQDTPPDTSKTAPTLDDVYALKNKLASLGEPDPLAVKEYDEVRERYDHLEHQLQDIDAAAAKIETMMTSTRSNMKRQFEEQFAVIARSFSSYFALLFGGGRADLVHSQDGIEIAVTPTGKRRRHVTLLSGGEKALTSLALLMAIIDAQSPPFMVLDEVDAALDEANSRRFAHLIARKQDTTQIIIITHNRETMAVADTLYGITMQQNGISRIYSVKMSDVALQQQQEEHQQMAI